MSPSKKYAWRDPGVAERYDARRFQSASQRLKHRRDEALVHALLRRAGGVERVLDLPCGTGRLAPGLDAAGWQVVGADVSLPMLEARSEAARASSARWLLADAERLPFAADAVDAIVSLRFLFHLREPELRARIFREMARVASRAVVGHVAYPFTAKYAGRYLRHRFGNEPRFRTASGARALREELDASGLELILLRPVSRLFSDKAFFLARPR